MCIFCKIASHEIPAKVIYEDDKFIAFLDISQTTKGHTLVVPKLHSNSIYDLVDESIDIMKVVKKVSLLLQKTFNPIGINIVSNNEKPLQSVEHFHIHVIPRYENDNFDIKFVDNSNNGDLDDVFGMIQKTKLDENLDNFDIRI